MAGQPEPGSNLWIGFDVTKLTVKDPGQLASTVIEVGQAFTVEVDFTFSGFLAAWLVALPINCTVTVKYESLGTEPEGAFVPTIKATTGLTTTGIVSVPANTLVAGGAYKLVGTVVVPGSPIAGYFEGPILQIIA